ncbi:hypothetical protein AVEN_136657-1 [Araneus ventricosus]|uniref:Uncharacterized protein n=1 Tax=Araneus ventricosus TaxID=182803 RepID=A0A4Y2C9I7_ARAVE|nr:hypothetical protein AVEN_136657-1 [Araneus ventricosus]
MNPQAKKSNGLKSRDLGSQSIGTPLPMQRPANVSVKKRDDIFMIVRWDRRPAEAGNSRKYEEQQSSPAYQYKRVPKLFLHDSRLIADF